MNAKSILSANNGANGMNSYRGCTHGCIYCDSRSACYQFTHPFEDVGVKQNAPALLDDALNRKRKPCMVGTGAMCAPYLPLEKDLRLTRRCLEVIEKHGCGATMLTKSDLVTRDLDILERINRASKAVVQMTLTTHDEALCRALEPNVCTARRRFEVLCECRERGIPTAVGLDPILPFINDTRGNIEGILDYCIRAGVRAVVSFGIGMTLREGNREYFYAALDRHFPGLKERYIRAFGNRYQIESPAAPELWKLLSDGCSAHGIMLGAENVFAWLSAFPRQKIQPELF